MKRHRAAILGFGRLGRACAAAVYDTEQLELAGVVRHAGAESRLPVPFERIPVASHLRELARLDSVLICVPPGAATGAARETLQLELPIVECAILEGAAREAHYEAIGTAAHHHKVPAVVGAGWNPGMFPLLRRAFELLVPDGRTEILGRPGASLHHSEAARRIPGVRDALAAEYRDAEGRLKRYVYAELAPGVDPHAVQAALAADPLFANEETQLFPVESAAALEAAGQGVFMERRGTARVGAHQDIVFEARFDVATFAARAMLDATCQLALLAPGAHLYSLWADDGAVGKARQAASTHGARGR